MNNTPLAWKSADEEQLTALMARRQLVFTEVTDALLKIGMTEAEIQVVTRHASEIREILARLDDKA